MKWIHALFMFVILLSGCALSSKSNDFSGLKSVDGANPVHINLTKYALHLGVVWPMLGDARLDQAVADFTKEAKKLGATKVRIVQSDETRLWWILPRSRCS
jgi:hypothetical protein